MIIYYHKKTGRIFGCILGRVHSQYELENKDLIQPQKVKKADIRRKVFNLIKIGKKDLVEYLNYRISREKRKIRLFRRKEENPIIEKLKNFILDIEKDRLIKWN